MSQTDNRASRQRQDVLVLTAGDVEMDTAAGTVSANGQPVSLSRQEFRLLQELLEHLDRVMTTEELITSVWGSGYVGDPSTLAVYIMRLRAKLERRTAATKHIRTIRGLGYIFDSTPPLPPRT